MFIITCSCISAFIWISFSANLSLANARSDTFDCLNFERKEVVLAKSDSEIISEEATMYITSRFVRYTLYILLFIIFSVFRMYHFSIIQYACQSYTNATYSLATRSSFIVRSFATPCALLLRARCLVIMVLITALGLVMEAYIICVGVMSPDPPLKGTETGSNIVVRL